MVTIRSMLSKTTSSLAYYPGAVHPLTEGPGGIDLFLESLYHHPDSKQRHVCRDMIAILNYSSSQPRWRLDCIQYCGSLKILHKKGMHCLKGTCFMVMSVRVIFPTIFSAHPLFLSFLPLSFCKGNSCLR